MDSDSELLRRFASSSDGGVFALLVDRHAAMVLGVALRVTGDRSLAEDVTQSVLAILVRKARSMRHECLIGWLHRTAFLEARNAARKAARYRRTLQQFSESAMTAPKPHEDTGEEILAHLDEAMTRLPQTDRRLVLLRYYEHHSVRDIASGSGITEEACRKRIRRAMNRLASLLGKRGVSTTGAGLAAVLAGHGLCVAPASAAALTAAAMQAAPALTTTAILTYTFQAMSTATTVKTSAVLVVLAAIPITLLWQRNRKLSDEVAYLRSAPSVVQPPSPAEISRSSPPHVPAPLAKSDSAAPGAPEKDPASQSPEAAFMSFFTGGKMKEIAKNEGEKRINQTFNRLCLMFPDLTDDQKTSIRAALEKKEAEDTAAALQFVEAGGILKIMNPEGLTQKDREELRKIAPDRQNQLTETDLLQPILTEDQFAQYSQVQEKRRVEQAEYTANDVLKNVGRYLDLDEEQKDSIFADLAQYQLNRQPASRTEGEVRHRSSGGRLSEEEVDIIRANLTPQQLEVYNQSQTPSHPPPP